MNSNIIDLNQKEISVISGGVEGTNTSASASDCFRSAGNWLYNKAVEVEKEVEKNAGNIIYTASVVGLTLFVQYIYLKVKNKGKGAVGMSSNIAQEVQQAMETKQQQL